MLKVIVLGEGLIPRGHGIAPRLQPFEADLTVIKKIIVTGGLHPYFIHPETGAKVLLTMANCEKMYKMYSGYVKKTAEPQKLQTSPYVKQETQSQPIKAVVVNNNPATVEEKKEEEKKEDDMKIAPVSSDSNNNSNNNSNKNNGNNNNNNHKK